MARFHREMQLSRPIETEPQQQKRQIIVVGIGFVKASTMMDKEIERR